MLKKDVKCVYKYEKELALKAIRCVLSFMLMLRLKVAWEAAS